MNKWFYLQILPLTSPAILRQFYKTLEKVIQGYQWWSAAVSTSDCLLYRQGLSLTPHSCSIRTLWMQIPWTQIFVSDHIQAKLCISSQWTERTPQKENAHHFLSAPGSALSPSKLYVLACVFSLIIDHVPGCLFLRIIGHTRIFPKRSLVVLSIKNLDEIPKEDRREIVLIRNIFSEE